ncbi:MAG: hypothetical protein COU09_02880 [Candidatus Harrisonbacteria bacterium CG10_big_fil_rev_8_21_14_0_10_44_23]|uniref:Uncharacterized protein n=1 Tax=Candidatus Harrisonbacteria bacterium CG10_big_fil_rev_8_21_14_0_10_44_23 TaxID=1974585 RepID=A0A2H0UPH5_9BACT|nr:MAG: hypothetical protein COU09_02880 [Candidatus Harrisonbacteria bacterium CG10_big_fil_rev_8_21_14_0_10_44_23]
MKATTLSMGENALTLLDLIQRAAAHKGLRLCEGASEARSEPIKKCKVGKELLAALSKRGVKKCNRYIKCDDVEFTLYVGFGVSDEHRGVLIVPIVVGTTGPFVPERGRFPTFQAFKVLVENDSDALAVAKELAASDGIVVVTWTELGLGGIRRLADLFTEFAGHNETVSRLGRSGEVFDPVPNPHYPQPGDELFILEPAQPKIIEMWRKQLNDYRSRLIV